MFTHYKTIQSVNLMITGIAFILSVYWLSIMLLALSSVYWLLKREEDKHAKQALFDGLSDLGKICVKHNGHIISGVSHDKHK